MSILRTTAVLLVVLALAGLEIVSGLEHIDRLRERRRGELTRLVTRDLERSAQATAALLAIGRSQAKRLAVHPRIQAELAVDGAPADLAPIEEVVLAVDLLRSVELVRSDGTGRRVVRAEDGRVRADKPLPESERERLLEVGLLLHHGERTDEAVWLAEPVIGSSGRRPLGHVLVGLTLDPLMTFVRDSTLLPGVVPRLVPRSSTGAGGFPEAGETETHIRQPVLDEPALFLEASIPDEALEQALAPVGEEHTWIIGSMVGILVVLALVGVVVLRLSQRTFRLEETERYLRWIRRVTDRYRALMEGAADLILILEPSTGAIREANAAARETLGLPAGGDVLGSGDEVPAAASLTPRLVGPSAERFETALRGTASGSTVAERELQIRASDGSTLSVEARLALIDVGDERVVEVSLRDVTQQRAMARQLQTNERLASLGLLTAGVAHEINNPLEGVGNYLSLLSRPELDAEKRSRYLDQVRRGFDRIRDIVHDLLSFARPAVESSRADLAQVAEGALGLAGFAGEFRGIEVRRVGLDEPLPVSGDSRRLEQVVLNLLLNASQAMAGRGTVCIRGERAVDEHGAAVARLVIEDDGPGIPEEDLDRLFDPFFSARGGTGLGLSVSFGIVAAHGGTLRAHNAPDGGAVFTISLPFAPLEGGAK